MQSDPSSSEFRLIADAEGASWVHIPTGRRLPVVSGGDGPVATAFLDEEYGYAASNPPNAAERERLARRGAAMSDGSFPIRDCREVEKAVHAMNRPTNKPNSAIRSHIVKRARSLGCTSNLPSTWDESTREQADVEQFEIDLENLGELNDDELAAATQQAEAVLDRMVEEASAEDAPPPSASQVQAATDLSVAIQDMHAERSRRDEAAAERRRQFDEAVALVRPSAGNGDSGTDDDTDDDNDDDDDDDRDQQPETDAATTNGPPRWARERDNDRRRRARAAIGRGDNPDDECPDGQVWDNSAGRCVDRSSANDGNGNAGSNGNGHRRGPLKIELTAKAPTLNPTLAEIAERQPSPGIADRRPELKITAAADVPHFFNGESIVSLDDLARAATERCKALGVGNGSPHFVPLAKLERSFPTVMDQDTMTPQQIKEGWDTMLQDLAGGDPMRASNMEGLVAAGGWCAPSEIRYDFFNVAEVAGLIDLPTFGVRRGGLRWPQSLTLADFFALDGAPTNGLPSNATMPWEWTEIDDINAISGEPTKSCLRPPCPNFDEQRLVLFGICVLAGNLTDDAFPELIRHFIALTVVAHSRVINRRLIAQMEEASIATTPDPNDSAINSWLGGLDLNATDYREKFGMQPNAVLEVVAPSWVRGVLRSDLAKKNALDKFEVADAELSRQLNVRNLRVQWVQDWQTREPANGNGDGNGDGAGNTIAPTDGTIPTNWPETARALMFSPGTFGRGNGMTLDLGVVRDSVLNATNDHTAAWSEEATMLARFGNESRVITLSTRATGVSGGQAEDGVLTGP